jgi:hypothetical protein
MIIGRTFPQGLTSGRMIKPDVICARDRRLSALRGHRQPDPLR